MSLREKLERTRVPDNNRSTYETFGVLENPFPSASQPLGHPRFDESEADEKIVNAIRQFDNDHATQVLVVEGTQGVGKTNLLNFYQEQLEDLYRTDGTFYIIRYYPDPEPTFDAIVRRVFQELGVTHLEAIGRKLSELDTVPDILNLARNNEVRTVIAKLGEAAEASEDELKQVASIALEWFVGLRLLNKHRDALGVYFRLDTVESKTQALRDLVVISEALDLLRGIFLLLDELEKQDYSQSKTVVLRYLSAIRALVDALPKRLFLVLALTSEARRRYFAMLPAIASRLQNRIALSPIQDEDEAIKLANFYIAHARTKAKSNSSTSKWRQGSEEIISRSSIAKLFHAGLRQAADRGLEGVTHREFLNNLRDAVDPTLKTGF